MSDQYLKSYLETTEKKHKSVGLGQGNLGSALSFDPIFPFSHWQSLISLFQLPIWKQWHFFLLPFGFVGLGKWFLTSGCYPNEGHGSNAVVPHTKDELRRVPEALLRPLPGHRCSCIPLSAAGHGKQRLGTTGLGDEL